ncbi:MAG: T9SS type A sorting domain-containing protein [Candidatus Eisenbacteria bacterium]
MVAHDFAFSGVAHANGERVINTPADHIFHLVRGDAAALAPGQAASRNRWYIREWFESARAAETALAQVDGHCDEAFTQAPAPLPHTLAVHAVDSPLCSTLKLLCDLPEALPATVEVFDIAGRRLSQRTLTPSSPGVTMPVEAGNGARFAPGAYFVRLSQGRQKPVSRMVLVAR